MKKSIMLVVNAWREWKVNGGRTQFCSNVCIRFKHHAQAMIACLQRTMNTLDWSEWLVPSAVHRLVDTSLLDVRLRMFRRRSSSRLEIERSIDHRWTKNHHQQTSHRLVQVSDRQWKNSWGSSRIMAQSRVRCPVRFYSRLSINYSKKSDFYFCE